MNFILFDSYQRTDLLPLTLTRPVADIRIGILTIREKWEKYFNATTSSFTATYFSKKFPATINEKNIFLNGSVLPDKSLVQQILKLKLNEAITDGNILIAVHLDKSSSSDFSPEKILVSSKKIKPLTEFQKI